MKSLSLFAATALLSTTPLLAEDVLSGTISIANTTTTASRTVKATPVKKTPAETKVITAKTIRERGYRTLPEALSHEAGITVASVGGPGQPRSIFMRGMGSGDVIVMIDGEPMTDFTAMSAPFGLEHIDLNGIEKIEVVQGAQSGAWGANAVAGVINIITKDSRDNGASISVGAGSYGARSFGFDVAKKGKHGSFYLSHSRYSTDGFSAKAPRDAEADAYQNETTHLRASITDDDGDTFGMFAHRIDARFDYDTTDANDTLSKGTSRMDNMGIFFKHDNGGHFAVKAKASLTHLHRKTQSPYGPFDTQGDRQAFSVVGTYRFAPDHTLSLGWDHRHISGGTTYAPTSAFSNNALFADYRYTAAELLGAETTFHAALRYDRFDKFANKVTYRFGIKRNCTALPGLHSAANIYSAYKAPSLYQLANAAGALRPEYTQGYDLSLGYKHWLTATYFKNKKSDAITFNTATYRYGNDTNETTTSGIELESRIPLGDTSVTLGANYTHLFQDHLVRRAQNSGNLFLDWHFYRASNLNLSLHYVGERDASPYAGGGRLKAYKTLDATLTTRFKNHVDLTLGVKNLLGAQYQTAKGYATAGRSVYARVKYRF